MGPGKCSIFPWNEAKDMLITNSLTAGTVHVAKWRSPLKKD